jgi:hypothetical protein
MALGDGEGEGRAVEHSEAVSEREPVPLWLAWLAVSVVLVVALREAQLGVAASLGKLALALWLAAKLALAQLAVALLGVTARLGKLALTL